MNKLGRGPLGDAIDQILLLLNIKALSLVVSEKKIFPSFSLYKPM